MVFQQNVGIRLSVDGARKAEADLRGVSGGIEKIGVSAASVRNLLGGLAGAFAGFVSVRAVMQASDAVTALNNQLKLATGSASSAAAAYQSLFEIAQRSRVNFTELGGTFASITRATQELGLTQQQVLEVTESIANAITVSGASAQASQAALMQLSQGLASGVLRGEELNSVMEQTPRLARALADGLGVPIGKLREMGKAGELTAEQVIGALRSQNSVLARELSQSTATVGQAFTQLQNAAIKATGRLDDTTGASQSLAKAIQGTSIAVQTLGDAFAKHGDAIKTAMGAIAGAATAAGLASVAANIGKIRIAFLALSATLAANPLTLALLGIGAAVGAGVANANSDKYGKLREHLEGVNRRLADANLSEERRNILLQDRLHLQRQLGLTSTAGGGRGFVNPDLVDPRVSTAAGSAASASVAAARVEREGRRAAKNIKDAFADAVSGGFSTAMEEFARITSEATAKSEGLSKTQAKLRDIMASPEWAGYSRQMQEQVIMAAAGSQASEDMAAARERERKSTEDTARLLEEYNEAQARVVQDAFAEATAAEEALRNYGLLRSQVQELTLAKLEEARVSGALTQDELENLDQRIAAQRRLVDAVRGMEVKEAATEAAKHAADEWKKATDQINQSLTDALMRGFQDGKSFARNLRDAVVNMFKTMVLRPVIQAIVQPIAGPIAQGISGVLGGGAGGLGGMVGSLFGAGGLGGSLMAGAGWMTGATTFGGSLAAAGSLLGSGTMGGLMSGLGMAAGALGPIALGALALRSIFGGKRGGPKVGGISGFVESGIGAGDEQGLVGLTDQTRAGLQRSFEEIARSFGATAAASFGVGVSTDPRGDAPSLLAMTAQVNGATVGNFIRGDVGRSEQDLQAAVAQMASRSLLSALRATDLGEAFNEYLRGVALDAPAEVHQAALQTMQTVRQFTDAMRGMGSQFDVVNRISVEARQRMIEFAGGIDAMVGSLATYFENFHTAEERRIATGQAIARDLSAAGLSLSDQQVLSMSRDQFRDLVDSLDLTTESGQRAYAGLVSVAGAFASITESADAIAAAQEAALEVAAQAASAELRRLADEAEAFRNAVKGVSETLRDEINRLRGVGDGGGQTLAALWAQFGTASAQARAGDLGAADNLTSLSQSIEEAVMSAASSRAEVDQVREQLAGSLTATMAALNGAAGRRSASVVGASPAVQPGTATPAASTGTATAPTAPGADILEQIAEQQQLMTALMNRFTTTITRWDTDGLPEERVLA